MRVPHAVARDVRVTHRVGDRVWIGSAEDRRSNPRAALQQVEVRRRVAERLRVAQLRSRSRMQTSRFSALVDSP